MKPEQQEIDRLRREVNKLKAERDILKNAAAFFAKEGSDMKFVFVAKHRNIWPVAWLCDATRDVDLQKRRTNILQRREPTRRVWQKSRRLSLSCCE
jgi:hypothetical protein